MTLKRSFTLCGFLAALVALWQALHWGRWWSPVLLPGPLEVAEYLAGAVRDGSLPRATLVTLRRLILGYLGGLALGLPAGLIAARFQVVRDTLGLLALGLQALPSVCWVPLALVWFGQTEAAVLFVVVMGTVWSVMLSTQDGVRAVPPIYVRAARTMGSRGLHTWFQVVLPASLPYVASGMKQGWAFAWRSLMAAEIYVTIMTGLGLGHLLHYGRELHAMEQVIGVMIVVVTVGLLTDRLVFAPLERSLHVRWGTGRAI